MGILGGLTPVRIALRARLQVEEVPFMDLSSLLTPEAVKVVSNTTSKKRLQTVEAGACCLWA